MNKRIRELAEQAGITFKPMVIEGEEYTYQCVDLNDYTEGVEDEAGCIRMFAELIVRECIDIVGEYSEDGAYCQRQMIKERFGVE